MNDRIAQIKDGVVTGFADATDDGQWIYGTPVHIQVGAKWSAERGFYDNPPTLEEMDEKLAGSLDDVARTSNYLIWLVLRAIVRIIKANRDKLTIPADVERFFKNIKSDF